MKDKSDGKTRKKK